MIKFRKNIEELKGYSSGKGEFSGKAEIFLDTNENPYDLLGMGYNRYPDPMQINLKKELIKIKKEQFGVDLKVENILIGNGIDEVIGLIVEMFCEPGEDSLAYFSPTFGMYEVVANIKNIGIKEFELDENFSISQDFSKISEDIKLIFICNPNNPTGNLTTNLENIEKASQEFNGIVVVDEAYIEFCPKKSVMTLLKKYDNLIIFQTFSKFWGLAGARCGIAIASEKIIKKGNLVKTSYNVNGITQEIVLKQFKNKDLIIKVKDEIIFEREKQKQNLEKLKIVEKVYKSDANFLLVKFTDGQKIFEYLRENGIVVRNFSQNKYTKNCLRISVGKREENEKVIEVLKKIIKK